MKKQIAFLVLLQLLLSCVAIAQNTTNDWKAVEQAFGRPGQQQADGAYKFGLGRGDLHVTVEGVQVTPTLALGSWVCFQRSRRRRHAHG